MPEREICLCRELTKVYEEVVRGYPKDFCKKPRKGECVLLIGKGKPIQRSDAMHKDKTPLKIIAQQLSEIWGINKREAYNLLQSIKPNEK